jgi:hypothetical protein
VRGRPLRSALVAVCALAAAVSTRDGARAEDPEKPAGRTPRCTVTGRILDGWEAGVPDAKVTWIGDAPAGDRSTAATVRTDDAGRFRLEIDGPIGEEVRGTIHATLGTQAARLVSLVVGVAHRVKDAGSIELFPARPLFVDVRSDDTPTPDAQVWLWAGRDVPAYIGTAKTSPTGRAEFAALSGMYLQAFARGPDGAVGEASLHIVPASEPIRARVPLGRSRVVDVRVTTDDSPARPIEGALVRRTYGVWLGCCVVTTMAVDVPDRIPPTDADGRVRLAVRASGTAEVQAQIAGRPRERVKIGPDQSSVTIVSPGLNTIPVEDGERPVPPDGTKIVVFGRTTSAAGLAGSMEGGAIAVPLTDPELQSAFAIAPDGSTAPLKPGRTTSFFRPRSVEVRLTDLDGGGIPDARVAIRSSPWLAWMWETPRRTDGAGRVRFDGLAPVRHFIEILPESNARGTSVGEVDLSRGDEVKEVILGQEGTLVARVTIDEKPSIPEWLRWEIPNGVVFDSAVDRSAGTVRARVRAIGKPSAAGSLELTGRGVRPGKISFAWPGGGETTSIDMPLFASPQVVVDVRADADSEVQMDVERWEPSAWNLKPWEQEWWSSGVGPYAAGRVILDLRAGRYRLRDRVTGVLSKPFDVTERGPGVAAVLDLTGLVTIRGRVEVPNAADAANVELVVDGDGIDAQHQKIPSGRSEGMTYDGKAFALRIPAGRRVTISPWHWKHQPALEGGEVTLVGPRDDVVLKMGPGATLVARLTHPDGRPMSAAAIQSTRISTTRRDRPTRSPALGTVSAIAGKTSTVSASGLPFGTRDVWIEVPGLAARRLERVSLASDTTDLGEVRLTFGCKVMLRRSQKQGDSGIDGYAFATFGPRQVRDLNRVFDSFEGLCAGRWRINVWRAGHDPQEQEKHAFEIDVDGEHDQTVDVNLDKAADPIPK